MRGMIRSWSALVHATRDEERGDAMRRGSVNLFVAGYDRAKRCIKLLNTPKKYSTQIARKSINPFIRQCWGIV